MTWTNANTSQKISMVRKVWHDECSASTLADAITRETHSKVTRNAVIGLYKRNPGIRASHPLRGGTKGTPPISEKAAKQWIPALGLAYDEASRHVLLYEVGHNQCHWPVNHAEPGEKHLFCGHGTVAGATYCDHHQARAGKPSRRT